MGKEWAKIHNQLNFLFDTATDKIMALHKYEGRTESHEQQFFVK